MQWLALVLKADNTNISLNRSVNLISTGENAVISKSVTLAPLSSDIVGKLNLTGNMLVCGKVDGENICHSIAERLNIFQMKNIIII